MRQRGSVHTKAPRARMLAAVVAAALVAVPVASHALPPLIALLGKQLLQDMVTSTVKGMLLDSLSGMGCKGVALANALATLDGLKGGGAGMPRGLAGMQGLQGMQGMAGMSPEMAEAMKRMMPAGGMPGGLDAEQSAMMAKMMGSLGAPLSVPETLATLDEMSDIGMLPKAVNAELKECMLVLPQSAPAMGMAFGMLKPMLPRLREARDQMHALSPAEQEELADTLAQEFDNVPAADRKAMLAELGGGMFPPRVVSSLSKRYAGK